MSKTRISDLPEGPQLAGTTAQEMAYERLRYAIMIGHIGPGVALTIRGLAKLLDVSPTPVREALRRLTAERGVTILDNRRVTTTPMTPQRFDELIALRKTLECHAAQRALPHISDITINEMEQIDLSMDAAIDKGDYATTVILNLQFHTLFFSANPEQVVMPMIESIWLQLGPFTRIALRHIGQNYTIDRHKEIIAALRRRDAKAVRAAVAADVCEGMGHLGRQGLIETFTQNQKNRAA